MKLLLFFLFTVGILLESTILQVPLTLILLIVLFVLTKSEDIFLLAFVLGIILDIVSMKTVGISSLFFVSFLFLISLYDKKYEIKTWPFILISSAIGSGVYLLLDNARHGVMLTVLSIFIAVGYFLAATWLLPSVRKN